jgi:hypothetical protein
MLHAKFMENINKLFIRNKETKLWCVMSDTQDWHARQQLITLKHLKLHTPRRIQFDIQRT